MIPEVGTVCRFEFTAKFAILNGVYRIRAETTFVDALASGVDFVENFYVPAGLQQSDFNTDRNTYLKDKIAVLESVNDINIVYYVPESAFTKVPDPSINEYYPLIAVIDLGVQDNVQRIIPLIDSIKDLVQANLGTNEPVQIITNSQNRIYLTDSEYQELVEARQANIRILSPLSVQLQKALEDNAVLAAKCAAYEAKLSKVSTTV